MHGASDSSPSAGPIPTPSILISRCEPNAAAMTFDSPRSLNTTTGGVGLGLGMIGVVGVGADASSPEHNLNQAVSGSIDRRSWVCSGARDDVCRRVPHYLDDWACGFRDKKVLSASIYIFLNNAIPGITFALLLADRTHNTLGVIEVPR